MLPIRSSEGTIVAFIGRASEHAGPRVPKYLNSPSTGLYAKSEVLFGLWEARGPLAGGARPVIGEGPFEAIAVTAACPGPYARIAACGAVPAPPPTPPAPAPPPPAAGPTPPSRSTHCAGQQTGAQPGSWSRSTPTRPDTAPP